MRKDAGTRDMLMEKIDYTDFVVMQVKKSLQKRAAARRRISHEQVDKRSRE